MSATPSKADGEKERLLDMVEAVLNGEANEETFARLDERLADDANARSIYLDFVDLHTGLRRRFLAPEGPTDAPLAVEPTEAAPSAGRGHFKIGAWIAFALAACFAGIWVSGPIGGNSSSGEGSVANDQHASLNGVAVLTRAVDAEWGTGKPSYEVGTPLPKGVFEIESGVVQLEFYSGAVAVLEGPARLDLESPMGGFLRSGKLRARVPPQAKGFTIGTQSGQVVDLGTEFAIGLNEEGDIAELHVIDGEVRYHPSSPAESEPVAVRGGEAMSLEGLGMANRALVLSEDQFIGPSQLESRARLHTTSRYAAWQAWRQQLAQDPALVAHYGYSPEPNWGRTFRNFSPDAGEETHGAIVGCQWDTGRWSGHKALRFRNASHRVSVELPGEHKSLSLVTWIAIDSFHPTNKIALLQPETDEGRAVFWTIDRVPNGGVLHFSESDRPNALDDRQHFSSVQHGIFDSDADHWVQLAVVYDADLGRVSHYRNGSLIGWKAISKRRPIGLGSADIGNWPYKEWAAGTPFETQNLVGRMDEFLVLNRPLTGAEIEDFYRVGAP